MSLSVDEAAERVRERNLARQPDVQRAYVAMYTCGRRMKGADTTAVTPSSVADLSERGCSG
jgi:hypothetical protein